MDTSLPSADGLSDRLAKIDQVEADLRLIEDGRNLGNPKAWRARLDRTILGLDLPEQLGGVPDCNQAILPLLLRFGAIDLNLRDVPGIGHSRLFARTDAVAEMRELASATADNGVRTSMAATEMNAGSDLRGLRTTARSVGGGYRLTGEKVAIYRLLEATHFVVLARLDDGLGMFLCASGSQGMTLNERNCVGLKANSWGNVVLTDVFVPAYYRIAPAEDAIAVFSQHFAFWRMPMTACSIGAARRALDYTARWLASRQAFGKTLLLDPGLMRQMESFRGKLYYHWTLLQHLARLLDEKRGRPDLLALSVKAEGIPEAYKVVDWCIERLGWRGCMEDCPLVSIQRDLACLRISSGASDALLDSLARRWALPFTSPDGAAASRDHFDWPILAFSNSTPA